MKVLRLGRRISLRDAMAIAAAAIAIVALVADVAIVQPLDRAVAAKRSAIAELRRAPAGAEAALASPRAQLAAFNARLPVAAQAQETVRRLHAGARASGLRLDRGQYRPLDSASGGLLQYQIVMPVSGSYPAMRRFLGEALHDLPYLALEGIEIRRGDGAPAAIEAELRFVAFLKAPP
jgi:hypothetical protein